MVQLNMALVFTIFSWKSLNDSHKLISKYDGTKLKLLVHLETIVQILMHTWQPHENYHAQTNKRKPRLHFSPHPLKKLTVKNIHIVRN